MIINNLMLKLKQRDNETIAKTRDMLLSMRGKIEYLSDISVHSNIRQEGMSYDLLMIGKYNSLKDFEAYVAHPVHVEVGKYIKGVVDSAATVMYESAGSNNKFNSM